jgi:hypothetical protein
MVGEQLAKYIPAVGKQKKTPLQKYLSRLYFPLNVIHVRQISGDDCISSSA